MFCQIGKVIRYAVKYNRSVVVDTYYLSQSFRDFLSFYFAPQSDAIILPDEAMMLELMGHEDVFPHFMRGRLDAYSITWDYDADTYIETETRQPVSFDFDRDYTEGLLVHHNAGGGMDSLYALRFLTLREHLRAALRERLRAIGGRPYHAIHIRNSDYKTSYEEAIAAIRDNVKPPVFVATDSSEALAYCKDVFGAGNVVSFSGCFSTAETPLHYLIVDAETTRTRNTEAILDLLTLAMADKLHLFPIQLDQPHPVYSGFSNLAKALSEDSGLLDRLIGRLPVAAVA